MWNISQMQGIVFVNGHTRPSSPIGFVDIQIFFLELVSDSIKAEGIKVFLSPSY